MRRLVRKLWLFFWFFIIITVGGYFLIRERVESVANGHIYMAEADIRQYKVGVVLGAQVLPDLVPSRALAYRLQTATDLYKKNKIQQIFMSGDGRSPYYDEVATMKKYAVGAGVPEADIIVDGAGLRTYDTCYRLKNEYQFGPVLIITQSEHLLRTVYTCRSLGVDAYGFASADIGVGNVTKADYWRAFVREKGALILAWFDVEMIHPSPMK